MEFPSALLGVALGTVLLPSLAKHHADDEPRRNTGAARLGAAPRVAARAAGGARALAARGTADFDALPVRPFHGERRLQMRSRCSAIASGLLGLILVKILAPGFYARQNMRTPVKIAFVTVLVTQALALMLMWPLGPRGADAGDEPRRVRQRGAAVHVPRAARALPAGAGLAGVRCVARRRAGRARRGTALAGRPGVVLDRGRAVDGVGRLALVCRGGAPSPTSARCGCSASGSPTSIAATARPTVRRRARERVACGRALPRARPAPLVAVTLPLRCGQRGFVQSA